ncbi:putative short-chain dehydrogenase [Poronia punctata]|nr:putative short-chain dehydrogenase [Poronia punctata]
MAGTVLLTGANSSMGLSAVARLLSTYPDLTAVLTVRNTSDSDPNTKRLRAIIAQHPKARASIHQLDLANLSAVHAFAENLAASITAGEYPALKSIICNAFYWNLVADSPLTVDGYETTMQVNHIAHVALVLRLLGSFAPDGGRVEVVSTVAHYRRKSSMTSFPPDVPDDIDDLIRQRPNADKQGWGAHLYGTSKLIATIWTYALNDYLEKDPKLQNITAVAINPGNLLDSRAFQTNTPASLGFMAKWIIGPLLPLFRLLIDKQFRSASAASHDLVDLAVGQAHPEARGYFTFLEKDEPDEIVLDGETKRKVWGKSAEWAKIDQSNTALDGAFS